MWWFTSVVRSFTGYKLKWIKLKWPDICSKALKQKQSFQLLNVGAPLFIILNML